MAAPYDDLRARAVRDGILRDHKGRVTALALNATDEEIAVASAALDAAEAANLALLRRLGVLGNRPANDLKGA